MTTKYLMMSTPLNPFLLHPDLPVVVVEGECIDTHGTAGLACITLHLLHRIERKLLCCFLLFASHLMHDSIVTSSVHRRREAAAMQRLLPTSRTQARASSLHGYSILSSAQPQLEPLSSPTHSFPSSPIALGPPPTRRSFGLKAFAFPA